MNRRRLLQLLGLAPFGGLLTAFSSTAAEEKRYEPSMFWTREAYRQPSSWVQMDTRPDYPGLSGVTHRIIHDHAYLCIKHESALGEFGCVGRGGSMLDSPIAYGVSISKLYFSQCIRRYNTELGRAMRRGNLIYPCDYRVQLMSDWASDGGIPQFTTWSCINDHWVGDDYAFTTERKINEWEQAEKKRKYFMGHAESTGKLKSIPADRVVYDECCSQDDPCEAHRKSVASQQDLDWIEKNKHLFVCDYLYT